MLDVALFLLTGSFPIGLASYLNWPSTARLEVLTTLHHVWFIPLCYAVLHKVLPLLVLVLTPLRMVGSMLPVGGSVSSLASS